MNRRLIATLLTFTPFLIAADKAEHLSTIADRKEIQDKWIVRHAEQDGALIPAQVGREPGDIITIKEGPAGGFALS